MIEIFVKRKISCGKKFCRKCKAVDYSGCHAGCDYYCMIFQKKLNDTNEGTDSYPIRLSECIAAEKGKNEYDDWKPEV